MTGSKSSSLFNAILYRRRRRRRQTNPALQSFLNDSIAEMTDEQKNSVMNFFKTCRLPAQKDAVKLTMAQYKDFRINMIHNSFDEYKQIWLFYFVCPDLVSQKQN